LDLRELKEIEEQNERSRLRLFGHVKRMHEHRKPKIFSEINSCGRRQGQTKL
jgi:hypothetical protein